MKTFLIKYKNLLLQECQGKQKAICEEMAILQFVLTHGVWKIISVEEE